MPAMSCGELLSTIKGDARKINFLLLGKGTRWKCFIKAEAMAKIGALSPEEDAFDHVTGLTHGEGNKFHFLVDGDKEAARETMKAAWRAEKLKWDDALFKVVGDEEPAAPAPGAPPSRPTRAAPDATVEINAIARDIDKACKDYPFAARRIGEMKAEVQALITTKPGLAALRVRELRDYLRTGVKAEDARRHMRSFATDLAGARNRATPEDADKLDKLKAGFESQLESDPPKALQILDAMRKLADTLNARSGKEMGDVLRDLVPRVQKAKALSALRAPQLEAARVALMTSMKSYDQPGVAVAATRQLRELQWLTADIEAHAAPDIVQRTLGRRLFLAKDDTGRTKLPGAAIADPDFIASVAADIYQTEDETKALYEAYRKKLTADTDALLPPGFAKPMKAANTINPLVPDAARPKLNAAQAKALQDYTSAVATKDGKMINTPLRTNQKLQPPYDKIYKNMRDAFASTRPMATPVEVTRDYLFDTPALVAAFLKQFEDGLASKATIYIPTFLSCGAGGRPISFKGQVVLFIKACRGLDLSPYTEVPQEKELLLDYRTPLRVLSINQQGEEYQVYLEQLPD